MFVMVCVFGVSNVPSAARSSTFEYRKRKKPRVASLVAEMAAAQPLKRSGRF
jgi:hypothetical protein